MRQLFPGRAGNGPAGMLSTQIARGDAARDRRDWSEAEECYRQALTADGTMAPIWIQLGHALKEQGKLTEAEAAYRNGNRLDPRSSDGFLQLGHLLKLDHRPVEALDAYTAALHLDAGNPAIEREILFCEKLVVGRINKTNASHHVYFDISDLVFYIGHHDSLSGIQRVQASIIMSLRELETAGLGIHFLSYVNDEGQFYEIDPPFVFSLLDDLPLPTIRRSVPFDRAAARGGYLPESAPFEPANTKNSVLCLLGAAWVNKDYALRVRNLKATYGFRFVMLIHDMIPIYARDTCDQGTAETFTQFLLGIHHLVELFLCVSQHTRKDLVEYYQNHGLSTPGGTVIGEGSSLPRVEAAQFDSAILTSSGLRDGNYILFVSTIEGRKNHMLAFRALQILIRERKDVPYLVCVGRLGWRSEEFIASCAASAFLQGRIKIFSDVSDSELAQLYKGCVFTIYPSFYEGWGLPVGESLAFGKLCIASNTTSLPEVGGDLVVYIDPRDAGALATTIGRFLDDQSALEAAERRIRDEYRPIQWKEVTDRILSACRASVETPANAPVPRLELGREYPVTSLPKLPNGLMGEEMATEMWSVRQRVISDGLFEEVDYQSGQNARTGAWCEAEEGRTWARMKGCWLAFGLLEACYDPLVVYAAYEVPEPCLGARLIVEISGGAPRSFPLRTQRGVVAISGVAATCVRGNQQYRVGFTVVGDETLGHRLDEIDRRRPCIGIRSFMVLPASDMPGRLAVLERLLSAP